jgi:putative transposase
MSLEQLIASNPDSRELKRALSVQMRCKGMKHSQIRSILGVPSSYISRWEKRYLEFGVEGLKLAHKGSQGYLSQGERESVVKWISEKSERTLSSVIDYIEKEYGVVYASLESYYTLLKEAGMSWQKGKKKVKGMMNLWYKSGTK